MVVHHQVGDIVRSYVRIPGNESRKFAKPIFHDLGRVSAWAATVPVPQNVPPPTDVLQSFSQRQKGQRCEEVNENYDYISPSKVKIRHTESISEKTIPITLMTIKIPNVEIQKLKEENEGLRKENVVLMKQLSLFKQLIRNPQRLNSVLRRLEERKNVTN